MASSRNLEILLRKLSTAEGKAIAVSLLINKLNVSIPKEIVESVIDNYIKRGMYAGAEELAKKAGFSSFSNFYTRTLRLNDFQPKETAVNEKDLEILREVLKIAYA